MDWFWFILWIMHRKKILWIFVRIHTFKCSTVYYYTSLEIKKCFTISKGKIKKKKRYEMCIIVYLCHYIFKSSFDLINIIKNPINNKLFTIQSVFSLIILLFLWFLHPLFKYLLHNNLFLSIQSHYIIWTQIQNSFIIIIQNYNHMPLFLPKSPLKLFSQKQNNSFHK